MIERHAERVLRPPRADGFTLNGPMPFCWASLEQSSARPDDAGAARPACRHRRTAASSHRGRLPITVRRRAAGAGHALMPPSGKQPCDDGRPGSRERSPGRRRLVTTVRQ